MRKSILFCFMLLAVLLCACGGDELHYLDTTTAATEETETATVRPMHGVVIGNYYYCIYHWWEDPDGDGIYRDGADKYSWATNGKSDCDLLRIDLTTGELTRIHVE